MNQTNTSKRIPTQINEFRGDYAFLSNFYPAPVSYMGQTYANTLCERATQILYFSDA